MIKNLIISFLLLFASIGANSQIRVGLYQDAKLAFYEDDYGNEPFTTDAVIIIKFFNGGNRADSWSKNIMIYTSYEYADLAGGEYKRWGAGFGYEFNLWRFKIAPSYDYGFIIRGFTTQSSNVMLDLSFRICDGLYINLLNSYTSRTDIGIWRHNMYAGLSADTENIVKLLRLLR
tara:strand:+ start:680 stop:1204 length:525 start_codon:yes stop_codon:yes gene_type:complete